MRTLVIQAKERLRVGDVFTVTTKTIKGKTRTWKYRVMALDSFHLNMLSSYYVARLDA